MYSKRRMAISISKKRTSKLIHTIRENTLSLNIHVLFLTNGFDTELRHNSLPLYKVCYASHNVRRVEFIIGNNIDEISLKECFPIMHALNTILVAYKIKTVVIIVDPKFKSDKILVRYKKGYNITGNSYTDFFG